MSERSRRQPIVSERRQGQKSALEALKAAREGGLKRVADYEVKKEAAVYDVVDEDQYAQLVAKRREEGGQFPCCICRIFSAV
jgi:DNA polymerase alpha subunit A